MFDIPLSDGVNCPGARNGLVPFRPAAERHWGTGGNLCRGDLWGSSPGSSIMLGTSAVVRALPTTSLRCPVGLRLPPGANSSSQQTNWKIHQMEQTQEPLAPGLTPKPSRRWLLAWTCIVKAWYLRCGLKGSDQAVSCSLSCSRSALSPGIILQLLHQFSARRYDRWNTKWDMWIIT